MNKQCFEFWYFMYGGQVGTLSVYYNFKNNDGTYTPGEEAVWRQQNNHGAHWQYARVNYAGMQTLITNFILEGKARFNTPGWYHLIVKSLK
jgi:hypothetical protein